MGDIDSVTVSRIQAMNFAPLTTRGHSPITWTFTPHSQSQITIGLHFPSSTAPTQLCTDHAHTCKQSPNHHHPITHTHTHYISPGHSPIHCRVLFSLATLQSGFPSFLSLFPCVPIPPLPLDYSLCLALWI